MMGMAELDPNQPWYSTRVDEVWGEIRYEAFGPRNSFVVFHGPNAKSECQVFMKAIGGVFNDQ